VRGRNRTQSDAIGREERVDSQQPLTSLVLSLSRLCRYQLLDAQDKVSATNSVTEMAGKVLTMMANRAFRWKAFLVFMILLQFALIVIVIYYGFAKE